MQNTKSNFLAVYELIIFKILVLLQNTLFSS